MTTKQDFERALIAVQEWLDSINHDEASGKPFKYKDSEDVMYHHAETLKTALTSAINNADGGGDVAECLNKILGVLGVDDLNINSRGLLEGYIRAASTPDAGLVSDKYHRHHEIHEGICITCYAMQGEINHLYRRLDSRDQVDAAECAGLRGEIDKLREALEGVREALEWYADDGYLGDSDGKQAREALNKIKEMEK